MVNFCQQVLKLLGPYMQVFTVEDIATQMSSGTKDSENQHNKNAKELEDWESPLH